MIAIEYPRTEDDNCMLSIPIVAYNALQSPTPAQTHPRFDLASPGFNLALVFVLFPASPAPPVSAPLSPHPTDPRVLAVFWPYTPLHPLKKPGLNGHFSLFAIWPCFFSFRPYFRSYFGPRLCKCTNLDQSLITPKSARNIAQREAAQGRRPGATAGRVPAMSQKCGRCMGVDRPGVRL